MIFNSPSIEIVLPSLPMLSVETILNPGPAIAGKLAKLLPFSSPSVDADGALAFVLVAKHDGGYKDCENNRERESPQSVVCPRYAHDYSLVPSYRTLPRAPAGPTSPVSCLFSCEPHRASVSDPDLAVKADDQIFFARPETACPSAWLTEMRVPAATRSASTSIDRM